MNGRSQTIPRVIRAFRGAKRLLYSNVPEKATWVIEEDGTPNQPQGVAMGIDLSQADLVVVGSGLYGLTIAERAASNGSDVIVLEKRRHIGGNAWSEQDSSTGIEIHRYGSHIFHTSNARVWDYLNRFATFNDYKHHVWTECGGRLFSMPISLATLSSFFGRRFTPEQGKQFLESQRIIESDPVDHNFETKALSLVGRDLYESLIRGYTSKQWQTDPKLLPSSIIGRIPVRFNLDTSYFDDVYQGVPIDGYGRLAENMIASERI